MAVERLSVSLGTSTPYDQVSAVIRGKTIPKIGQTFMLDLDGTQVNFEIETVSEVVRGAAESIYSITGKEHSSEWLFRPVDVTVNMGWNGSEYTMPSASGILARCGIPCVYNAPDFIPTAGGLGWTVKNSGSQKTARICEMSFQALLNKLFSWSQGFGPGKICWRVRAGTVYVWAQASSFGAVLELTEAMCADIKIESQKIRTYTEPTNTNGDPVETPESTYSFNYNYGDFTFSGGMSINGASMTYSDGLLVSVTATSGNTEKAETYGYSWYWGAPCLTVKDTTIIETVEEESTRKRRQTLYSYGRQHEGSTTGTGRDVPVLTQEVTQSWTDGTLDPEKTIVSYCSSGNGFYSTSAVKLVDGEVVDVQHSVSRGSPGGAASQATEKRCTGYTQTWTTPQTPQPGYSTIPTNLPVDGATASNYLAQQRWLNGKTEHKITAELIDQPAFNPIGGQIIYRGETFFAIDANFVQTSSGKRMAITGVQWE